MPRGLETCTVCARLFSRLVDGRCLECLGRVDFQRAKALRQEARPKVVENLVECDRCRVRKPKDEFFYAPVAYGTGVCKVCVLARVGKSGRPKLRDPQATEHVCSACELVKPASEYLIDRKGYVNSRCHSCRLEASRRGHHDRKARKLEALKRGAEIY